jgi:hypothetical protein
MDFVVSMARGKIVFQISMDMIDFELVFTLALACLAMSHRQIKDLRNEALHIKNSRSISMLSKFQNFTVNFKDFLQIRGGRIHPLDLHLSVCQVVMRRNT